MFARKGVFSSVGRAAVAATVVAVAITAFEPSMAYAGSSPAGKGLSEAKGAVTDISARRRHYHGGGGGGAAAAAAFAGILGTGLAIAAAQNRREYYEDYGPRYYAPAPYSYGGYQPHGGYGYRSYGW